MPRLLALVLALLLPLQLAWSAAAAYCQHETVVAVAAPGVEQAPHLGHHAHEHQAAAAQSPSAASAQDSAPDGTGPFAPDPDCGACHALALSWLPVGSGAGALPGATSQAAPRAAQAITSAPARVPDRPQWPRHTA